MYEFILNMWKMRRFTDIQVQKCVTKGFITQIQADEILATPQV